MELKQYAAEHIIENGKHYPEKWVNRSFIEVADAQRALDAERESLSKRCMCEHEWDADGVLISRSECFYHAEQTTQLAALQAQLRQVEGAYQKLLNVIDDSHDDDLPIEIIEARDEAYKFLVAQDAGKEDVSHE